VLRQNTIRQETGRFKKDALLEGKKEKSFLRAYLRFETKEREMARRQKKKTALRKDCVPPC